MAQEIVRVPQPVVVYVSSWVSAFINGFLMALGIFAAVALTRHFFQVGICG